MAKPVITVTIDPDGSAVVSVNGAKGAKCHKLTENLEKALGTTIKSEKTKEFYEKEEQRITTGN